MFRLAAVKVSLADDNCLKIEKPNQNYCHNMCATNYHNTQTKPHVNIRKITLYVIKLKKEIKADNFFSYYM